MVVHNTPELLSSVKAREMSYYGDILRADRTNFKKDVIVICMPAEHKKVKCTTIKMDTRQECGQGQGKGNGE